MNKLFLSAAIIATMFYSAGYAQKTNDKNTNKNKSADKIVLINTDFGNIKIRLYNQTPKHRDNFIKLTSEKFFDSLLFHRVINGFMIQGGDPQSKNAKPGIMLGNGDVGYTIPAEFNDSMYHKKGALAAARQGDDVNPEKASSGCQFYIVQGKKYSDEELNTIETRTNKKIPASQRQVYKTTGGTPFLDHNYTVFGEVTEGLDVIDKIASVQTDRGDRPVKDVRMKIKIIQ